MEKAYIVKSSYDVYHEDDSIGVFLDKTKCDNFIKTKNEARKAEKILIERCEKCRLNEEFDLRDECSDCAIKNDRYGEYCENEHNDYTTPHYYCEEIEIMG